MKTSGDDMHHAAPPSLKEEHDELMDQLEYAASLEGEVGERARSLRDALHTHIRREDDVMAILSSIEDLSHGHWPSDADQLLDRFMIVERDIGKMLREHDAISTLLKPLQRAAEREKEEEVVRFCRALAHHAALEEEVLYPAALVAGRFLRLWESERESVGTAAD